MLVLYPPCIPALNTYNPTATKRIFLKTTDTVASSDERTWTLGVFVPSNLSHVGAIFIAEASCYSLPEEIAKLFSHLPSCLFSHISFVSVKIPLKKIAWLCFLPGVGAAHDFPFCDPGCQKQPVSGTWLSPKERIMSNKIGQSLWWLLRLLVDGLSVKFIHLSLIKSKETEAKRILCLWKGEDSN